VIDTFAFKAFVERVVRAVSVDFAWGDVSIFVAGVFDVRWNIRRVTDVIVDIICVPAGISVMPCILRLICIRVCNVRTVVLRPQICRRRVASACKNEKHAKSESQIESVSNPHDDSPTTDKARKSNKIGVLGGVIPPHANPLA
jgi:hypothetical protein